MTDAEKFAMVFRAAADGVVYGGVSGFMSRETYEEQKCTAHVRGVIRTYLPSDSAPLYFAFDGIAQVFEAIAKAERST